MVEVAPDAFEVTDPVAVAVTEAARIDLVDDRVLPPGNAVEIGSLQSRPSSQVVTEPPFSWIVCPVIQPASFEAR